MARSDWLAASGVLIPHYHRKVQPRMGDLNLAQDVALDGCLRELTKSRQGRLSQLMDSDSAVPYGTSLTYL